MPKFESFEQQNINPVENPREAYEKAEEDEATLKAQLGGAKSADEIMEIAMKLKTIEGSKKEMIDVAHEEALKEEEEHKMYDEAKAEDEFRTMFDEAKKEDAERTTIKETEKLNAELENLRSQIAGKNVDQIMETAAKMKEIEKRINELSATKKEEETEAQTEKDKQEYESILAKIKGEPQEEKLVETPEKVETLTDQLRIQYDKVLDTIRIKEGQENQLTKQAKDLQNERQKAKDTGDTNKLSEIAKKFDEINTQSEKNKNGEKLSEIHIWHKEEKDKLEKQIEELKQKSAEAYHVYNRSKRKSDYSEYSKIEKELENASKKRPEIENEYRERISTQEQKWEENGLYGLNKERKRLVVEFKKQYGFDEAAGKEMAKKFYGKAGESDMARIVINNYFGTELPIFSKEFKLEKYKRSSGEEKYFVVKDNSENGIYNKTLLVKKQIETYQKAMAANEAIKKIPEDTIREIFKEHRFELDALRRLYNAGDYYHPQYRDESFDEIYGPFAGKEGRVDDMFVDPEDRFYPKHEELEKISGEKDPYYFRERAKVNSQVMINSLFLHKIAKEKGLI